MPNRNKLKSTSPDIHATTHAFSGSPHLTRALESVVACISGDVDFNLFRFGMLALWQVYLQHTQLNLDFKQGQSKGKLPLVIKAQICAMMSVKLQAAKQTLSPIDGRRRSVNEIYLGTPVPARGTACGLAPPSSTILRDACRLPLALAAETSTGRKSLIKFSHPVQLFHTPSRDSSFTIRLAT